MTPSKVDILFGLLEAATLGIYFLVESHIWNHALIPLIIFQGSLIVTYIFLKSHVVEHHLSSLMKSADTLHSLPLAKCMTGEEFYNEFPKAVRGAKHTVDIAYLDTLPPDTVALKSTAMEKYYDEFPKLVREHGNVRFRRVERLSPEKSEWLDKLVRTMDGKRNFSLACIDMGPKRKMPHLSVQVVDGRLTYVVAIAKHDSGALPRDLMVGGEEAARLWSSYYEEMLWRSAVEVIRNGIVDRDAWDNMRGRMAETGGAA